MIWYLSLQRWYCILEYCIWEITKMILYLRVTKDDTYLRVTKDDTVFESTVFERYQRWHSIWVYKVDTVFDSQYLGVNKDNAVFDSQYLGVNKDDTVFDLGESDFHQISVAPVAWSFGPTKRL